MDPQTLTYASLAVAFGAFALALFTLWLVWSRERKRKASDAERAESDRRWQDYLNDPYWEDNDPANWWKRGRDSDSSEEKTGDK